MVNVKGVMEAERHGFQVFLSFQNETSGDIIDEIEKDAQSTFGTAIVRSIRVENKGADIGPYLRQLQVLGEEPLKKHHDIFLKIHTKSKSRARRVLFGSLCGNRERTRKLYTRLRQSKSVGMVGPTGRVWASPWAREQNPHGTKVDRKVGMLWQQGEVDAMNRTWQIMHPPMSFEKGVWDMARIIAGSVYWARPDAVLYELLLRSVDKLEESMPHGYRKASCCQTSHALERLMPTMAVTIQGLDVVSAERLLAA
jgi:lipopolysaccharide biosynthesis protein